MLFIKRLGRYIYLYEKKKTCILSKHFSLMLCNSIYRVSHLTLPALITLLLIQIQKMFARSYILSKILWFFIWDDMIFLFAFWQNVPRRIQWPIMKIVRGHWKAAVMENELAQNTLRILLCMFPLIIGLLLCPCSKS